VGHDRAELLVIPAVRGGAPRKLATLSAPGDYSWGLRFTAWSPDGKWIAVSDALQTGGPMSLLLVALETGERRQLTRSPVEYDDFSPAFSPAMDHLAFVRYSRFGAAAGDLYLLKLSNDLTPSGEPERLTAFARQISSPVWTANGLSVLFVRHDPGGSPALWRINMGREKRIEPLLIPADNSLTMALSPRGNKIVYTRESENVSIWGIELTRRHAAKHIQPQIASTWTEENPQFSPDGQKIAFQSSRSGGMELWLCDRDGSHPRQLTHLNAVVSGFPRWSPDGRKIVFHSRTKSSASLYVIDVDGGEPEHLTSEAGNNESPSWSHDGKWIYFTSSRSGQFHVWRLPANGGSPVRMSAQSGWCPLESKDGQFLYYVTVTSRCCLRAIPLSGGPEEELFSGVSGGGSSYAPAKDGIYFIRDLDRKHKRDLAFFSFASKQISTIAEIPKPVSLGLALSPDEKLLLYSQVDRRSSDLMLVDNFR
jgi:Tol biopolymer transport system component